MKSTASSNWDRALCYKSDFRRALLWFNFDFQTLIYLISSSLSGLDQDNLLPQRMCQKEGKKTKQKTMEHAMPVWTQPWSRGERLSVAHYSWRPPLHTNTHACMHACMHAGGYARTHRVKNTAVTHTCFCSSRCMCLRHQIVTEQLCISPYACTHIHTRTHIQRVLQGCSVWRVSSAGVVLL